MKYHSFKLKLEEGEEWERKIRPILERIFFKYSAENVDYTVRPELQRRGIDIIMERRPLLIQVKTRDYKFYKNDDILFELVSVIEEGIEGWLFTIDADAMFYCWRNEDDDGLIDSYLVWLDKPNREWIKSKADQYTHKQSGTEHVRRYKTKFFCIPIPDFPPGTLHRSGEFIIDSRTEELSTDRFKEAEPPKRTDKKLELKDFL